MYWGRMVPQSAPDRSESRGIHFTACREARARGAVVFPSSCLLEKSYGSPFLD